MEIQDVEWIETTGRTLSKLSRIIMEQANEIVRVKKENAMLSKTIEDLELRYQTNEPS